MLKPKKIHRDEDTTLIPKLRVILATLLLFIIIGFLVVIGSLYDPIISGQQQEEEKISNNYLLYECSKAEGYN
jgi:hypothetical protein